uniref:Ring finger protein 215 n=1 Tax=Varanus komodoensis TaxID=61221 RepID=A0A8D2IRP7_VARKO
ATSLWPCPVLGCLGTVVVGSHCRESVLTGLRPHFFTDGSDHSQFPCAGRGLQATAKITYQAVLLENVGVTLTLWSTCGLSRGGLYGEWQGVICTGENSSRVQKYLQQLWNAILLIALVLCTGVIMQAQRQSRHSRRDQESELDLKQHIAQRLSALKTRRYHPGKPPRSWAHEIDSCAICLDRFHKNQCLRVLPCLHEFHRDCVDPWLLLQQTCPLCKHNILGTCCQDS